MFYSQASSHLSPPSAPPMPDAGRLPPFMGYYRTDGQVGTRNYWLVLPLYTGESRQFALLKDALLNSLGYNSPNPYLAQLRALREQYRAGSYFQAPIPPTDLPTPMPLFANIDGVKFLSSVDSPGVDSSISSATTADSPWPMMAGYCANPNVGGITILCRAGAACYADLLRTYIDQCNPTFAKPLVVVDRMDYTTESDWMAAAIRNTFQSMTVLNRQTRQPAPLSRLTIGVRCDQTNGFSAYPAIDQSIRLLAESGATVLLANAGLTPFSGNVNHPFANLRSLPKGGLTILPLPGDANEVTTAMTAAGCTLHLSTVALAWPTGNPIVPVAELATKPSDHNRQTGGIDMATNGDYLVDQTAEAILHYSLKVASGEAQTASERRDIDDFK